MRTSICSVDAGCSTTRASALWLLREKVCTSFTPDRACVYPSSAGEGCADPNQPKKHLMACGRTQGNVQNWFGRAAVQRNSDGL